MPFKPFPDDAPSIGVRGQTAIPFNLGKRDPQIVWQCAGPMGHTALLPRSARQSSGGTRLIMPRSVQFTPRLMNAVQAAHYLGMSASKLRTKDIPHKRDGGNVCYEISDLDAYADALPYDGQGESNTCDAVFKIVRS